MEPFAVADPYNRVGGQAQELAFADPCAREYLDRYPVEPGGQLAGCGQPASASSRKRGGGRSQVGMSPEKTGLRVGASS